MIREVTEEIITVDYLPLSLSLSLSFSEEQGKARHGTARHGKARQAQASVGRSVG